MLITVTSHKGGVGKTVTAIHLAAFLREEFGEGSTVLVDADPNGSALEWAERGMEVGRPLPFNVVSPDADPGEEENVVYDSQGRLHGEDLEAAVYASDLLVIPTTPEPMALNALMLLLEDLEDLDGAAEYKTLLTMVPWWNRAGNWARRALGDQGVPMFSSDIRRREAFQDASLEGVLVHEVNKRRAQQGWEDYLQTGREVISGR
jgi:chromosome partitioning protein